MGRLIDIFLLYMFGAITYQTWSYFSDKAIAERRDGERRREEISAAENIMYKTWRYCKDKVIASQEKHVFWTDESYSPPKEWLWRQHVKM
jgi:hypothetical protein